MPDIRRDRSVLSGTLALLLGALAIGIVVLGVVVFTRSLSGESVRLADGPQQVTLPPDRTYGIYVEDADNSGYSESCSIQDSEGHELPQGSGGLFAGSSDTQALDIAFPTGSGSLLIDCVVPGEQVTVQPVPNIVALVLDLAIAAVLGLVATGFLVVWCLTRSSHRQPTTPEQPAPART